MCSKDLTELPELKELLNRLIVRKHMCSVTVASLLPLLLGYIAYRMVVDLGARLVPQDVFFLIGLFAAIVLAWTLSSVILASAKVNHIAANPLRRFMLGAMYRMEHGSTEPFNPKAHFREMALMIAVFNRLFGCQDRCLAELVDVIHNLVDNAIKYTPEGGSVSLSVGWVKDDLVIAVTDTGCGVPAEYRERVFDPAFRAPGTAKVEGQGLGLSFVRSIVRFYGGTCRCDSNPGSGSTFTVTLPLKKVEVRH